MYSTMKTRVDGEKLIQLVKEYKILYDYNDRHYCDMEKKEAVWRQIGKKLNVPGKECKKTWFLLRDAYRRVLKRVSDCSREQVLLRRKWKHENDMAFILPYLRSRLRLVNVEVKEENVDQDQTEIIEYDSVQDNPIPSPVSSVSLIPSPVPYNPDMEESYSKPGRHDTDDRLSDTGEPPMKCDKYSADNPKSQTPIDKLFEYLAWTVQKFPIEEQIIAKGRVFEIVSSMEMEIFKKSQEKAADHNDA